MASPEEVSVSSPDGLRRKKATTHKTIRAAAAKTANITARRLSAILSLNETFSGSDDIGNNLIEEISCLRDR